jgi:hypothetical protein
MSTNSISNRSQHYARTGFRYAIASLALALALSSVALAGGFQLSVEAPASNSPQLKDAALVVRTFGCMTPADAVLSATAEGLVNGKRTSLKLEMAQAGTGVYTIKQQWPLEGFWVIAINGEYKGMTSSMLVELGPGGKVHANTKLVEGTRKGPHVRGSSRKWAAADIESTLQSLAAGKAQASSEGNTDVTPASSRPTTLIIAGLGAFLFLIGFVTITRRARATSK